MNRISALPGPPAPEPNPSTGSDRPFLLIFSNDPSYSAGERLAWVLFLFTSFQLTFNWPHLQLIAGERTRLFSGLLCGLSLLSLFLVRRRDKTTGIEVIICLVLTGLGLTGTLFSATPLTSFLRTATLLLSGLGGFWCSRILLGDPVRQRAFINLGGILLVSLLVLQFGLLIRAWPSGLDPITKHPLAGLIYLLFFAPLNLILTHRKGTALPAWAMMGLSWMLFIMMLLKTAVLMPFVLALTALARKHLRPVYLLLLIPAAAGLVIVAPFFYSQSRIDQDMESIFYRAESYPFSWHIIRQNPLWGNGLWAPRQKYLDDYTAKFKAMGNGVFDKYVHKIRVSENLVLTFSADLGLPFTLLYCLSVGFILVRLFRSGGAARPPGLIHPLALILPLTAWMVHSMIFDSLLHPQICWFAHILLGLADRTASGRVDSSPGEIRS